MVMKKLSLSRLLAIVVGIDWIPSALVQEIVSDARDRFAGLAGVTVQVHEHGTLQAHVLAAALDCRSEIRAETAASGDFFHPLEERTPPPIRYDDGSLPKYHPNRDNIRDARWDRKKRLASRRRRETLPELAIAS